MVQQDFRAASYKRIQAARGRITTPQKRMGVTETATQRIQRQKQEQLDQQQKDKNYREAETIVLSGLSSSAQRTNSDVRFSRIKEGNEQFIVRREGIFSKKISPQTNPQPKFTGTVTRADEAGLNKPSFFQKTVTGAKAFFTGDSSSLQYSPPNPTEQSSKAYKAYYSERRTESLGSAAALGSVIGSSEIKPASAAGRTLLVKFAQRPKLVAAVAANVVSLVGGKAAFKRIEETRPDYQVASSPDKYKLSNTELTSIRESSRAQDNYLFGVPSYFGITSSNFEQNLQQNLASRGLSKEEYTPIIDRLKRENKALGPIRFGQFAVADFTGEQVGQTLFAVNKAKSFYTTSRVLPLINKEIKITAGVKAGTFTFGRLGLAGASEGASGIQGYETTTTGKYASLGKTAAYGSVGGLTAGAIGTPIILRTKVLGIKPKTQQFFATLSDAPFESIGDYSAMFTDYLRKRSGGIVVSSRIDKGKDFYRFSSVLEGGTKGRPMKIYTVESANVLGGISGKKGSFSFTPSTSSQQTSSKQNVKSYSMTKSSSNALSTNVKPQTSLFVRTKSNVRVPSYTGVPSNVLTKTNSLISAKTNSNINTLVNVKTPTKVPSVIKSNTFLSTNVRTNTNVRTSTNTNTDTNTNTNVNVLTPKIPFLPFIPNLGGGGGFGGGRRGKGGKRVSSYLPSITALSLGIKASKGKKSKTGFTGLEIRGI
jgi:hypothetical protein